MLADVVEGYVLVKPDGAIQDGGVHTNVNPDTGKHDAAEVNLTVCAFDVPAVVPFGAPQFGVASGIDAISRLLL